MQYQNLAVLALFSAGTLCADNIATYTDQAAFLAAAQTIPNTTTELETFSSPAITAPDLSVQTVSGMGPYGPYAGYGRVANGVWRDCLGRPCGDPATGREYYYSTTTWQFSKPTYAFGATFNYDQDNGPLASGISLTADTAGGNIAAPLTDGFFGFVSQAPFTSVVVWNGPGLSDDRQDQYYTMDNLEFETTAPEVGTTALMLIGFALVAGAKRLGLLTNKPDSRRQ